MKKLFTILSAFLGFIPFLAVGQSVGLGPYIGVAGAINNTWIVLDNELQDNEHHEHQPTFGPAGGLVLGYKFNEQHSVQVEGLISKQGAKYDLLNSDRNVVGKKEIDLTYFAVPILFKLAGTGTTRFNIHFGPQIAFLIKGEEVNTFSESVKVSNQNMGSFNGETIPAGTYVMSKLEPEGTQSQLNKFDPSLLLGFGVEHDLSDQLYLSANIRLNYGWTNINKDEVLTRKYDLDTYTLRYNVLGGLQIGLHYFLQTP